MKTVPKLMEDGTTVQIPTENVYSPCICTICQAEHFGGNYRICPDCEEYGPEPFDGEEL